LKIGQNDTPIFPQMKFPLSVFSVEICGSHLTSTAKPHLANCIAYETIRAVERNLVADLHLIKRLGAG
jgi:hypothetical protein